MLNPARRDDLVSVPSHIEFAVLTIGHFEQIDREIGGQETPDTIFLSGVQQCQLSIDDNICTALKGGHDDIDAPRCVLQRDLVGQ